MLPSNRLPRSHNNCSQLIRLARQTRQSFCGNEPTFCEKLQPKRGLISLLFRYAELARKIGARPRSTRGSVICSYGRSRSQKLVAQSPPYEILRQCAGQLNHPERKRFRPLLHFNLSHISEFLSKFFETIITSVSDLKFFSPIKNQKSKIKNPYPYASTLGILPHI